MLRLIISTKQLYIFLWFFRFKRRHDSFNLSKTSIITSPNQRGISVFAQFTDLVVEEKCDQEQSRQQGIWWMIKILCIQCFFVKDRVVLWRGWCGCLKRMVWLFEEGGVVLWRGWCGTLKRVVWLFEEGGVVLWRGWCGTLKLVMWFFKEYGV